jgi:hypothetical protein
MQNVSLLCKNKAVLQIRDVYPESRIMIFFHLGFRILDPTIQKEEEGGKIFPTFFVAIYLAKLFYF